jgi:hypothetical protein
MATNETLKTCVDEVVELAAVQVHKRVRGRATKNGRPHLNCDDFEIFQCAAKAETERKGVSGERERERRGEKAVKWGGFAGS